MHKKTQRNNYALASSAISDIPLSIDKRDSQALYKCEAADFKQNSSIYQAFNQSKSRAEQSISLHFSTARPFYGDGGEDYYERRELQEGSNYNIQQTKPFPMQKAKSKKSPNKKLMIYGYSNMVLFHKRVNNILLEHKKRIFMMLYRVKKEDRAYLLHPNKKNTSFYSGQTNSTSREDALYRIGLGAKKEDRRSFAQQILQGINIIEGWVQYRVLLDKRNCLNLMFQFGNDRKKFSLQLSESLKVDNAHNQNYFLTDYHQSNEISLTNALPQQIEESLVYTLEHNSYSTRKQLTQSTLEKLPTLKNYPTHPQFQEKTYFQQGESQNSKKNSPMYKLKAFSSSQATYKEEIKRVLPLKVDFNFLENIQINVDGLTDCSLQYGNTISDDQNRVIDHEESLQPDELHESGQLTDTNQLEDVSEYLKKIAIPRSNTAQTSKMIDNSAKYSDVSSYRMENTAHRQEQPYQVIVNYVNNNHPPAIQDQTVLRKYNSSPFEDKNTNPKFEKYYVAGRDLHPAFATPKFTSEIKNDEYVLPARQSQEKLISQLDNDRIRIFGPNMQKAPEPVHIPPIAKLRGNFSPKGPFSPRIAPIPTSSDKRILSPKMPTERNIKVINNRGPPHPPIRIIEQPVRYPSKSPDYQHQRPIILQRPAQLPPNLNPRQRQPHPFNVPQFSPSPPKPRLIQNTNIIRNELPLNKYIMKGAIVSPPKSINQQRHLQSREKMVNMYQREDYGYAPSQFEQKTPFKVLAKAHPSENHIMHIQRQYQLPTEARPFKAHPPTAHQLPASRPNPIIKELVQTEKPPLIESKRPQSSASSPKLFFNYKSHAESHLDEQIVVNSHHLTKNSSSISRPKSMNSKLFLTLKKEL